MQCLDVSPLLPPSSLQSENLGGLGVKTGIAEPAHTSNQRSEVGVCWCTQLNSPQSCSTFAPGLAPVVLACSRTSTVSVYHHPDPMNLARKINCWIYTHRKICDVKSSIRKQQLWFLKALIITLLWKTYATNSPSNKFAYLCPPFWVLRSRMTTSSWLQACLTSLCRGMQAAISHLWAIRALKNITIRLP